MILLEPPCHTLILIVHFSVTCEDNLVIYKQ